jgi:hypothetical protein
VRQRSSGSDIEVLLEQRSPEVSVMPGLWELPLLRESEDKDVRMTVRHAIMNVKYIVRVRDVRENDLATLAVIDSERQWVLLRDAGGMALTGLARKVLKRVIASAGSLWQVN